MAKLTTIKGPAIFVAQYVSDEGPFNSLDGIAGWAAGLGFKGIQIPIDDRLIDIERAASDQSYCDSLLGILRGHGIQLTDLSSHLQGQLIAVHPAYDVLFDSFAPLSLRGNVKARTEWARKMLLLAAKASKNLGLKTHATFSGAFAWPYMYPWPQRPEILVEKAFEELASRWKPILDAFDEVDVDVCYEIHPGEDLHDGVSFERFLDKLDGHRRACILYDPSHFVLQQLDYLAFIDIYHERIRIFHAKDAEFRPDGRQGVYGGYSSWADRAGRFRALGDGQVDFKGIFTKLAKYNYQGWAILESECAFKDKIVCAVEGAKFVKENIIKQFRAISSLVSLMQRLQAADESRRLQILEEHYKREAEKPRSAHKRRAECTNKHAPDASPLSDTPLDDDLNQLLKGTSIDENGRVCFYSSTSLYHIEAGGAKDRPDLTQG